MTFPNWVRVSNSPNLESIITKLCLRERELLFERVFDHGKRSKDSIKRGIAENCQNEDNDLIHEFIYRYLLYIYIE